MLDTETRQRLCAARLRLSDGDPSPIAAIARDTGFSLYNFTRLFKAVFGSSPHHFRVRGRMERARLLLAGTKRPVTEICLDLGFSSLGTFSRVFSAQTGLSPKAFRRRYACGSDLDRELRPACMSLMRSAYEGFKSGL